jgi:hypothetical protein
MLAWIEGGEGGGWRWHHAGGILTWHLTWKNGFWNFWRFLQVSTVNSFLRSHSRLCTLRLSVCLSVYIYRQIREHQEIVKRRRHVVFIENHHLSVENIQGGTGQCSDPPCVMLYNDDMSPSLATISTHNCSRSFVSLISAPAPVLNHVYHWRK